MSTFPSHQRAAATHSTRSRCRRGQGTSSDESRRRRAKQSRCQPYWVGRWLGVLISGTPGRSASANSRRCARGATIRDNDRVRLIGRLRLLMVGLVVICGACACDRVSAGRWSESPSATSWPVRPVNTTTPSGPVPPVSEAARAAGLVDVRGVVPDAAIDLRYATANNFTGTQLYPPGARCLVHESMAEGLAAAAAVLRPHGQVLVFWDCYRPHDVQVRMFDVVPNPAWVARPGKYAHSHEAGRSVDVTFASAQRQCPSVRRSGELCLADMGTDFDDFSSRATAFATQGVSAEAQANRAHLRAAMQAGGLTVYSGEWWHFDGPGAGVDRPILEVPVD